MLKPPFYCTKCPGEKTEDDFYLLPSGNRRRECKACCKRRTRKRYEQDPETWKDEVRKWRAKHPKKVKEYDRRSQSRQIADGRRQQWTREWREKNPDKWKAQQERALEKERRRGYPHSAKRRALEYSAFVEDINRTEVWVRDEGICGICQEVVDPSDFHIDHIHPLSKGGMHEYANVQVSHPFCNRSKGAKVV